uniref:NADH dehydrogenase subunit 4L n=1 Tax=Megalurothrips usitatus TaxID=439358 RepID=UPI00206D58EC|nr:NADH dehydrogenase subunit 4L [Megalurothrips usitatus]UPM56587.1 NADH dehydrogenase subunit 4L [Megalurothrips usitatus]WAT94219.1 NADH dehydrogenase subunit 4L [Megalurothrips usitatus]
MVSYFLFSVYLYFINMNSFMNSLLILESLSLLIFFSLVHLMYLFFSLKLILFYFIFIVSESSIGLSILVKFIKFHGFNNFKSMNISMF